MNIGVDIRSIVEKQYSGVGEYTFNILFSLLNIDSVNRYFLFYNSFRKVDTSFWEKFSNVVVCHRNFPNKIINISAALVGVPKIETMINHRLDVLFVPNISFISWESTTRTVMTVHDLAYEFFPEFFSFQRRLWHKTVNPHRLCSRANSLIAVSQNTKADLIERYKINSEKIKVIYSGIGPQYLDDQGRIALGCVRYKYNLPAKFILFLGTLEPRKNILTALMAFERYVRKTRDSQMHFVLAGGLGWMYEPILKFIQNSEFKKRIHYLGYVDSQDKPALYMMAELFFYPSYYEGFGFPVLEALTMQTPVVTSFTSCLGEVGGEHVILADPYNVEDLSIALENGLDMKISSDVSKSIKEKFAWRKSAVKVLNLLQGL